jgi:hypothetical protein
VARMDFTALFYAQSHNRENLVKDLDSLMRTEPHSLTILTYASEKSPIECFGAYDRNRKFSCIHSQDGVSLFNLVFESPQVESETPVIEGRFFIYEDPDLLNTYVLMTIEPQDFVRRALLPFVERSYPRIFLTIIDHQRMKLLLYRFKDNCDFTDLRVVRAVLRSRFAGQKTKREAIIPYVSWPYLGLAGAFDFAQEHNSWFQSLTFEALRDSTVCAEITVARDGVIKTDGQLCRVFDNLASAICKTAHENHKLFRMRSRRDSPSLDVKPLTVNFGREQLADEEERIKLIEVMRLLDKASLSVVHSNPYLQLSVIDYLDGSTFELWVLNPRELIIVPQLKGTVAAIRRLVSHVFDNYAEGNIEDFQMVR